MSIPLTDHLKTSLFGVNRNVRISHDKRPCKTNASAVLTRYDTNWLPCPAYIPIGPDEFLVAAGFYALELDPLELFCHRILTEPNKWFSVGDALAAGKPELSQITRQRAASRVRRTHCWRIGPHRLAKLVYRQLGPGKPSDCLVRPDRRQRRKTRTAMLLFGCHQAVLRKSSVARTPAGQIPGIEFCQSASHPAANFCRV